MANSNTAATSEPVVRTADSFPPLLLAMSAYVDEATGLVLFTGRANQFSIAPTEITVPAAMVEAIFHTVLGMRLRQAQAMQAAASAAALIDEANKRRHDAGHVQ